MKKYLEKNVYDAAMERIAYLFSEFDSVLVAFSGGKDSSVCLNLCYDYARKNGLLEKLAMYHLDYEAQYQMTTDYVTSTFSKFPEIEKFWLCVPIGASCACSISQKGKWIPWESSKRDIWVRKMPESPYLVTKETVGFEFTEGVQDYDFQERFCKFYAKSHGKTAVVIGIRTDESLNRYCAIDRKDKKTAYKNINWLTVLDDNTFNAYPIYDWNVTDIWTANGKFGYEYNRLYDLYYKAGLKLEQMRVANPFHACGTENLKLYKVIDPNNWGKMLGRVDGVNFAGLYGGTTAMGWKSIKLPEGYTWKQYLDFLLNTLDENTRNHFIRIFDSSKKYWLEKGGNVNKHTFKQLKKINADIVDKGQSVRFPDMETIIFNEYPDDLDVTQFSSVPSYKRMCVCILKNDYYCTYMGFGKTKEAMEKRKKTLEKYKNL